MTMLVEQIKRFALSIDYVTEEHFKRIKELLRNYCESIESWFYEIQVNMNDRIMINQQVEQSSWLTTVFTLDKEPGEPRTPIKNPDGSYTGQTTYAYNENRQMWIVREDKNSLKVGRDHYIDLWSRSPSEEIPPYWNYYKPETNNVKTSIIIPLKSSGERTFGFLNLEFNKYLEPHPEIQKELEEIAESFSILWTLKKNIAFSNQNTDKALEDLVRTCPRPLNNPMNRPQLFLAYPVDVCLDVMGTIRDVLDSNEFREKFEVADWRKMNQAGNINTQVIQKISSCKYGICYFSELITNQEQTRKYEISLNVTFEAGMFQSLTINPMSEFINWIPIWEEHSKIPFDFAQQRAIKVPRLSGELNEYKFRGMLENAIRGLIA